LGRSLSGAAGGWPTHPQLYAGGQFVGVLDVTREMAEEREQVGELKDLVAAGA